MPRFDCAPCSGQGVRLTPVSLCALLRFMQPPTFFELILLVFDFVFAFWPIILLAPIASRRNILPKMVTLWVFWAVVRVVLLFNPNPINASMLIPEPLSTNLFFAVGAVLVVLLQLTKAVKARNKVQARSRQR